MSDVKQGNLSNGGKDLTDGNANTDASNKPQVNSLSGPLVMSFTGSVSCRSFHTFTIYINVCVNVKNTLILYIYYTN